MRLQGWAFIISFVRDEVAKSRKIFPHDDIWVESVAVWINFKVSYSVILSKSWTSQMRHNILKLDKHIFNFLPIAPSRSLTDESFRLMNKRREC